MESGIQSPESGIHDVESGIQDPLGFLYMGREETLFLKRAKAVLTEPDRLEIAVSSVHNMFHPAVFLFKISMCSSLCSLAVQAKLSADCTFEEVKSWQSAHNTSAVPIQLNGQLPYFKNVIHSCLVQTDNRNSLMYLRAKRNKESTGEAVVFLRTLS